MGRVEEEAGGGEGARFSFDLVLSFSLRFSAFGVAGQMRIMAAIGCKLPLPLQVATQVASCPMHT